MADSSYDMNPGWNQTQPNPQLENEFDHSVRNVVPESTQRFSSPQGPQDISYPTYQQQYQQQSFTFTVPIRQVDQQYNESGFFDQQVSPSRQPQAARPFAPARNVYSDPSSSLQDAHLPQAIYRDNSRGYTYPQHSHHSGLGQLQGGVEHTGITPAHHEFAGGDNAQRSRPPSVFVSPPTNNYDLYQSPPQEQPMDQQLSIHRPNDRFFGSRDTVQDDPVAPANKRPRGLEDTAGSYKDGDGPDQDPENKGDAQKPKPTGACARCKGLKVRCEFISDPDICKRCLNGGHECVIPGRKKRRPPPKREHLLSQIRDQATQIKTLMAQLEEANRSRSEVSHSREPSNAPSPTHSAANTDRLSSVSLPTSSSYTFLDTDDAGEVRSTSGEHIARTDVLDWIAKARASLEEFGGYISMGGPSATREMLGGDEDDVDGSPDHLPPGGPDEYEFSVIDDEDAGALTQTELGVGVDGAVSDQYFSADEGTLAVGRGQGHPPRSVSPSEASVRKAGPTERLANIPNAAAPIGFFAHMMATRRRRGSRPGSDVDEDDRGLANDEFFRPSQVSNRPFFDDGEQYPRILKEGIVTPREVEVLFKIYWDYMNLSVSLLDPDLYSSQQKTFVRSPFLFSVICAIASKYYSPRPDLYQKLMRHARQAAGEALIGGRKSVEVVHAYILLSLYPVPCRRWEDDRGWVYLGLAIRIASDLNLHHPNTAKPKNEQHGREMLNRTRAWLNCFNLDRSTGSQYGKPPTISNTDYTAHHSGRWWNSSLWNMKNFDIHIAGYNAELRVMARFALQIRGNSSNPSGFDKTVDVAKVALETDEELAKLWETWYQKTEDNNDLSDPKACFRTGLLRFAYGYARLTALSWGFQFGFGKKGSASTDRRLLWSCYRAAKDVVRAYVDHVGIPSQRIYLRHGPEAQSVFITFASAFLIKLMQPKFDGYLTREQRVEARGLVQQVVDVLGSPEVALDDGHYPKLYSRFLKGLLDTPMADVDRPVPIITRDSPVMEQRVQAKAKSLSPTSQRQKLFRRSASPSREACSTPSSARTSQTPPPPSTTGFNDTFDQMPMNTDPFSNSMLLSSDGFSNMNEQYFNPLLPFDSELLQSMQTLTDPVAWPEMILPGFAWMNPLHNPDTEMS